MPNGDPPKPFARNTKMCGTVLLNPQLLPQSGRWLKVTPKKAVRLLALFPIYQEEMDLKLRNGAEELERLLKRHGITELLDLRRINVVTGKRPGAVM